MSAAWKTPGCWLLLGLPWPQDAQAGMAECAVALAPPLVPRTAVGPGAAEALDLAEELGAQPQPGRAVFFSDLTLCLDSRGQSWPALGIDHEAVIGELLAAPVPSLYLTLSQKAHAILCDASREGLRIHYPDGEIEHVSARTRQDVHDALARQLGTDWPPYMQSLIDQGVLRS